MSPPWLLAFAALSYRIRRFTVYMTVGGSMIRQAFLLAFILAAAASVAAQGTTSRVLGVVTDQTGAVVPGATITLTNDGTGVSFVTVSTGAGTYTFEAIQVGSYSLTVELQGFKRFTSRGNPVNISEPTTINVRLEPGGV